MGVPQECPSLTSKSSDLVQPHPHPLPVVSGLPWFTVLKRKYVCSRLGWRGRSKEGSVAAMDASH